MAPQVPPVDERRARIFDLLVQATAAHEQYETVYLKRADPQWAYWEAGFMLERSLSKLLPDQVPQEQLGRMLTQWAAEHEQNGGETPRVEYLADRLAQPWR